MENTNISSIFA